MLNLKENEVGSSKSTKHEDVPVSSFAKIYEFVPPQAEKLNTNNTNAGTKQSTKYHFNELEYMERPSYVLKTSEIFPYDAEQTDSKSLAKNIQDTLRPEFISNYDHELKADTMKDFQGLSIGFKDGQRIMTSRQKDIVEVSEASKVLKNQVIANLVSMLDDL